MGAALGEILWNYFLKDGAGISAKNGHVTAVLTHADLPYLRGLMDAHVMYSAQLHAMVEKLSQHDYVKVDLLIEERERE